MVPKHAHATTPDVKPEKTEVSFTKCGNVQNFSVSQILREINSMDSRSSKSEIFQNQTLELYSNKNGSFSTSIIRPSILISHKKECTWKKILKFPH